MLKIKPRGKPPSSGPTLTIRGHNMYMGPGHKPFMRGVKNFLRIYRKIGLKSKTAPPTEFFPWDFYTILFFYITVANDS
jgi:hypothetical protein